MKNNEANAKKPNRKPRKLELKKLSLVRLSEVVGGQLRTTYSTNNTNYYCY